MDADPVATFESSLDGLADSVRRVEPVDFHDAISAVITEPAIGVPLSIEGVSLAETAVQTDFDATDLEAAQTGVTPVGLGVADYGTVTIQSRAEGDELVSLYTDCHVPVLRAEDVTRDMPAGFDRLGADFERGQTSQILATGPSATADMGGLIQGVHGPAEIHVLVVEP